MHELALFAGAGGGILGGKLLGWRCVCAVEIEAYCREVLMRRQDEGHLEPFPIWDDVCTFDGKPWRGLVDVVSGGFPCQDISVAGRGRGLAGARSGLWSHMARIIREVGPRHVLVENSPMLVSRGLHRVLGDLAALGYDARWGVFSAAGVGAPHLRKRMWIVANAIGAGVRRGSGGLRGAEAASDREGHQWEWSRLSLGDRGARMGDTNSQGLEVGQGESSDDGAEQSAAVRAGWWESEPDVGRVVDGVASRVDRIRALGNGQVPAVVVRAWEGLTDG